MAEVTSGQLRSSPDGPVVGPPADEEPHAAAVGRHAGRGLRWALAGTLVYKLGSFALSLVMVRLLAPGDFGLYAVALAATGFIMHVNDMGMIAATVQWRGNVTAMHATARTLAIAFSVGWYAVFWFGAPVIADLAGSPEATPVVRLLTLIVLIDGVTAVSVGMIQRRFEQDKLMKAIAIGFAAGSVLTVTLAVRGAGAYSFVAGQLVQGVVVAVLALRMAGLPFTLGLDREVARRLVAFGAPLAVALGVESMVLYADSMIVGHVLGTAALGYYLLAFNISSWVPGIVGTASRYVSIPAFSRLAEGGDDDLDHGVRRALPLMVVIVTPIAVVMLVLPVALVDVLYGSEWHAAAEALRFLAVLMVARMVTALILDIQTGLGNTRKVVGVNITWFAGLVPAVWAGAHLDGIRGAAVADATVSVCLALPVAGLTLQRSGVDLVPVLRGVVRPLLAGAAAAVVMAATTLVVETSLARLLLAGGLGTLVYAAGVVPPRLWAARRHRPLSAVEAPGGAG